MNRVMWVRDIHGPWDRAGEPDFREKVLGSDLLIPSQRINKLQSSYRSYKMS